METLGMALSSEMRRLKSTWESDRGWPKRLEWMELKGIRGWIGERVDFKFPIVALVGENGSGKSTVLQAAASVYAPPSGGKTFYPSDFFPETAWEQIADASIRYSVREGDATYVTSLRKFSDRWRGYSERRERNVEYIDLRRIQPVSARIGYARIAKVGVTETTFQTFEPDKLARLSEVMGKRYDSAKFSMTDIDDKRAVPVVSLSGLQYSGFHQGAGELAAAELMQVDFPKRSIVLIDEIETSLYPRAQRRLMKDLATLARARELQIILTTHSPYVLEELPPEARCYILRGAVGRILATGVSPYFAMTQMDDEKHPDADVYVEDSASEAFVKEALFRGNRSILQRVQITAFGSASVGRALGIMANENRFPRPSCVLLDGDQLESKGCNILPGGDAPERVVFNALKDQNWVVIAGKINRNSSELIDACNAAMAIDDHHKWTSHAAERMYVGSDFLWSAMCSVWANECATAEEIGKIVEPIQDTLSGI
jgi:predicted ATPase